MRHRLKVVKITIAQESAESAPMTSTDIPRDRRASLLLVFRSAGWNADIAGPRCEPLPLHFATGPHPRWFHSDFFQQGWGRMMALLSDLPSHGTPATGKTPLLLCHRPTIPRSPR